ncbi:DNA topoisomerase [Spirochaetia bacterium]|nr:DNA topoisomerase [Spirochaetia bacterium]
MIVLTEKPGVAGEFAHVLGCTKKGAYYENSDTCVVWAVGYLLELFEPGDYNEAWQKWNIDDLPMIPPRMQYRPKPDTEAQLKVIKQCFTKWGNTGLLLATDAEREGELIGETILHYVGFTDYGKARRFWVSEALTPDVIKVGIAAAKPLKDYDKYKNEGYARQHADWLVGLNLSRLAGLKFNIPKVSVGRVQTPLLAAVYSREKAIAEFKKDFFYQLELTLKKDAAEFSLYLAKDVDGEVTNKFTEKEPYLAEAEKACKGTKTAAIEKVTVTQKETLPPQLYNLTGLQKDANKRFSYSPAKTLELAQSLYETHKCLSYPRTPSKILGDNNVDLFREKYELLKKAYPAAAEGTLDTYITASNKRLFNSAELRDHHALIPLAPVPASAPEAERNVYALVLERFFVQLKPPYKYESIAVTAAASGYHFSGTGKRVLSEGWKAGKAKDEEDTEEEAVFPQLTQGESLPVTNIARLQKETKPKTHFTEAGLLQLMENPRGEDNGKLVGVGTPATRASIIKNLFDKEYIRQEKKNILITDKGKFLIENMGKNKYLARFTSLRETTDWEQKLADNPPEFLVGINNYLKESIPAVKSDTTFGTFERSGIGTCPVCGKNILPGKSSYFCSGYKDGCDFKIWKAICGATVSEKDAQILLGGKKTGKKNFTKKDGKTFDAKLELQGKEVKFVFEEKKK